MKAAVTLLLHLVVLLSLSGTVVQGEPVIQLDGETLSTPPAMASISELGKAIARINTLEKWNEALQNDVSDLKTQNSALQNDVSDLKTQNSALQNDTSDLKTENSALQNDTSALKTQNSALQKDVSALKTENSEKKVAFSASLTGGNGGNVGPFNTDTRLVFKNVVTNIGQAYSSFTGVFVAPLRGLYYFRFTAYDYRHSSMGVRLYHNGTRILSNGLYSDSFMSNALAVELQEGDEVYMILPSGWGLYDSSSKDTTFTGFLLFPM